MENYAQIDSDGVVVNICEKPTAEDVAEYNSTHASRLRACPEECKVGWVRRNGVFGAPE